MSNYAYDPKHRGYQPTKSTLFAQAQAAGFDDTTLKAAAEVDDFGGFEGTFEEPEPEPDEVAREFARADVELEAIDLGDVHV